VDYTLNIVSKSRFFKHSRAAGKVLDFLSVLEWEPCV